MLRIKSSSTRICCKIQRVQQNINRSAIMCPRNFFLKPVGKGFIHIFSRLRLEKYYSRALCLKKSSSRHTLRASKVNNLYQERFLKTETNASQISRPFLVERNMNMRCFGSQSPWDLRRHHGISIRRPTKVGVLRDSHNLFSTPYRIFEWFFGAKKKKNCSRRFRAKKQQCRGR
jgi:hypothetical protein